MDPRRTLYNMAMAALLKEAELPQAARDSMYEQTREGLARLEKGPLKTQSFKSLAGLQGVAPPGLGPAIPAGMALNHGYGMNIPSLASKAIKPSHEAKLRTARKLTEAP